MIHILGVGGLDSDGGSVFCGKERRFDERCDEGVVGDSGDVAAIAAYVEGSATCRGWWKRQWWSGN